MNEGVEIIINFIWDIAFTILASATICAVINKKNNKELTLKIIKIFLLILIYYLILIIIKIMYLNNELRYIESFLGRLELAYEMICWAIIIGLIIYNKKHINIQINKTEIILMISQIAFGIICVAILAKSNILYISPMRNNTYIGNFYFNADTHRSIVQMISDISVTHKIHPLYRFIVLPIILPIIFINKIFQSTIFSYYLEIADAYTICFMQIILNAISSVIFYRLLNLEKINKKISITSTVIFMFSLSMMWTSILPETYAITTVTLLLFFYLYKKRKISAIIAAIFAIGANIMAAVPIALIAIIEIFKNRKIIKEYTKGRYKAIIILLIITGACIIPFLLDYVWAWVCNSGSWNETFINSINYFLVTLLLGPNFIQNMSLFVQVNNFEIITVIFFGIFFIIGAIGFITNRKKLMCNICLCYLVIAYLLHVIIGYGFVNGIIYSPLYCWAFILLVAFGLNYLYSYIKGRKLIIIISINLIIGLIIHNVNWIVKLGSYLKEYQFNIQTNRDVGVYKYLENGDSFEAFFIYDESLFRCSDGKKIISNIDQCMQENRCMIGLLKDSNWFKLYFENGELKLNISNKVNLIEKDYFYIFGMGLREKFILRTEGDSKYELIEYESGEKIITNCILNNIDYANYCVYLKNSEGKNIKIYENEQGIYIDIDNKVEILDESVPIKIPNFEGKEYKQQLKILFNEIMVNITKEGPKPNFIAYDKVWYRDAAIIAKVLQETGNLNQIEEWIASIDEIYDKQNGTKEADNLGEVLYLLSLIDNPNQELINEILSEAQTLQKIEGYIQGITDGFEHPVYQTKWLIYGMKELGLDYSNFTVPDIKDTYSELLWFDRENEINKMSISDRWQYLYYANLHYNKKDIKYKKINYPISNEIMPSRANFENMSILNSNFTEAKLITPHAWSAAEMFLYLLEL